MTNDWAPEPWKLTEQDRMSSFVEDGELDGIFEIEDREMLYKIPDGAMHRIIACVNACAGVPTEHLKYFADMTTRVFNEGAEWYVYKYIKEATDGRDDTVSGD